MLHSLIVRLLANGLGLWIAAELLAAVDYGDDWVVLLIATVIFFLVNAIIRPIVILLSLPAIIITFGLFTLVVNGLMLYLVTILYPAFSVDTFGAAIITVIIVWVANLAIDTLIPGK